MERPTWMVEPADRAVQDAGELCPAADAEADDPVAFAAEMGFVADERQAEVLRAIANPEIKKGILNCSRQWGKSTTVAAGAVHRLVTRPGSKVVVVAPSKRQAALLVRTAVAMLKARGIRTQKDGIYEVSAVLPNESVLIGLPCREDTARGLASVSLLVVDEAAKVPDAMYEAVRPMGVVVNGDVWLMSTPWLATGFFYDAWENGGPRWARFAVKATECPRIPAAYLEEQRSEMPGWAFRREYMAEFVRDDLSAFDAEVVEEAMDDGIAPMDMDWAAFGAAQRQMNQNFYGNSGDGKKNGIERNQPCF